MAKLYILKDENNKKEKIKFNLFLNGYDVTKLYCSGELEGVDIQSGTHEILLGLHSKFASWRRPQTVLFDVSENEDITFVIKTSKLLKFQTFAIYAQSFYCLFLLGPIRNTKRMFKSGSDSAGAMNEVVYHYGTFFLLCLIIMLTNMVLIIYLVLMQKQQTIIEVERRIT